MIVIRTVNSERLLMGAQNHSNKVEKTDRIIFALRYNGVSFFKTEVFNNASIAIQHHCRDLRVSHRSLSYHDRLTEAVYHNTVNSRPLLMRVDNISSAVGSDLHPFNLI